MPEDERDVDFDKAAAQWTELYSFMAAESLVYILPTPAGCELQDLVFTGNIGIVLTHLDEPTIILSNFASEPRRGEEHIGAAYFTQLGFTCLQPPDFFEGEAELKHLYDNVYIGGYGQRSKEKAYDWMESQFDMKIIRLYEDDPYFYHIDCCVFPITKDDTLVCTEMFDKDELAELAEVTNILPVTYDDCLQGICNSVRVGGTIINMSNLHQLDRNSDDYKNERNKNNKLSDICAERALELNFFDLSEFLKGGAVLSCLVMHLNRYSYEVDLL